MKRICVWKRQKGCKADHPPAQKKIAEDAHMKRPASQDMNAGLEGFPHHFVKVSLGLALCELYPVVTTAHNLPVSLSLR
jgi:hypothetical protein